MTIKVNQFNRKVRDKSKPMVRCLKDVLNITSTKPIAAEISEKKSIRRDRN